MKINNIVFLVLLCIIIPVKASGQNDLHNRNTAEDKAQKVVTLLYSKGINEPMVKNIKIMKLIDGFNRDYGGDWLKSVTAKEGVLILRRDENTVHYWYLEDAILIEKTKDDIVIRL